jgi:hypothetical protein
MDVCVPPAQYSTRQVPLSRLALPIYFNLQVKYVGRLGRYLLFLLFDYLLDYLPNPTYYLPTYLVLTQITQNSFSSPFYPALVCLELRRNPVVPTAIVGEKVIRRFPE